MLAAPYTRVPLYRGQPDNIVGVLHAKDMFRAVPGGRRAGRRQGRRHHDASPGSSPNTTILNDQLGAFRAATSISPSWSTNTARCRAS